MCSDVGPMNVILCSSKNLGEAGVLGKKTIARMHGIGAGDLASRDEGRDVEIAIASCRRTDTDAFVGEAHVHGVRVSGRVYGNGRDTKLTAGALNAQRNLSSVGNQNFIEHGKLSRRLASAHRSANAAYSMMIRGSPYSTGWAFSTRIALTVPARGAGIWFIVFIASMMSSVSP